MSFSGAVKLADLSDYLAPSQSCIVTTKTTAQPPASATGVSTRGVVSLEVEDDIRGSGFGQIKSTPATNKASITLNDCLACSGCVTSAETVLIQQQSAKHLMDTLRSLQSVAEGDRPVVVVSVSPQSRASLAAHFGLRVAPLARRLSHFLRTLGVDRVLDATDALSLALNETASEFVAVFRSSPTRLPLLCSECPGWVCYAEKTQGAAMIPHMSNVKSPQQIIGRFTKRHYRSKSVLHVSVQPCFDKKLEASRDDCIVDTDADSDSGSDSVRETDTVIATNEMLEILNECGIDLSTYTGESELDTLDTDRRLSLVRVADEGASGGYADHIFRYAAKQLFSVNLSQQSSLDWRPSPRSTDLRELTLTVEGKPVLRFARMYGFRHLQSLVKQIKSGRCQYHYVEVMACPAGCVNGGGQIKLAQSSTVAQQRAHVKTVESLYRGLGDSGTSSGNDSERIPLIDDASQHPFARWVYASESATTESIGADIRASFKAIEAADINPLTIKW